MNSGTYEKYKIVAAKWSWIPWLLAGVAVVIYVLLIAMNVFIAVKITKQSGHSAYGWAYFIISGYLQNISSNTRKTV
jgi:hypothetical protein